MKNEIIAPQPIIRKIFFTLFFISQTYAQWETGVSFNYKSEIPETGFGLHLSRNLPLQFSSFGLKSRLSLDYFFSSKDTKNDFNADIHADIIAALFYQKSQPYFGLSIGGSRYSVDDFDEYIFFLGSFAGIRILLTDLVQPYVEVYSNKYFSSFDVTKIGQEISSFQFMGRIGITLKL